MAKSLIGLNKMELDTPCLVLDKQLLNANLLMMQQHGQKHHVNIRPHCKTHKCSAIAQLQIDYGAIGVSVAKISEAEVLLEKNIPNVLITSPIITKNKISRLVSCIEKSPSTMIVVDSEENIHTLNHAGEQNKQTINVLVDIDPGIGRTGVNPEKALALALSIQQQPWLKLMGIQCYAGNLQHISSFAERRQQSLQVMHRASELLRLFRSYGLNCPILTGTGTGTYDIDIEASGVTEIQPGSYTVMDVEYATIGSRENPAHFNVFQPAMTLLTTVISANRTEHVTVDAGTKSIYMDFVNKPQIISHQGLAYDWGGFGDEQGKITAAPGFQLPGCGAVLELIVPHCDPTINLFDQFFIIEQGRVVDVWDIDLRGKCQ